jgi:hypothetical protein
MYSRWTVLMIPRVVQGRPNEWKCYRTIHSCVFPNPRRAQPPDLLESLPEFACFVNIDLAGLLGVGLSELFADPQCLDSFDENASL